MEGREGWHAAVHGVANRHVSDSATEQQQQMAFIQLSLSSGYKYVLIMVSFHFGLKLSHADRLLPLVAKTILEKIILHEEFLLNHSDQGTHFMGQVLQQVSTRLAGFMTLLWTCMPVCAQSCLTLCYP